MYDAIIPRLKNRGYSRLIHKKDRIKILDETKKLSRRELEVLEKISQNSKLPYKQIASLLFISEKTISMHTYNISKKINVKNRKENLANFYKENLKEKRQCINF